VPNSSGPADNLPVEIRLDDTARPGSVVEPLAALLLRLARRELERQRAAAMPRDQVEIVVGEAGVSP
jgi:hypothetical protein